MRSFAARHAIAQRERLARCGAAVGLFARTDRAFRIEEPCALRRKNDLRRRVRRSEVAIGESFCEDASACCPVKIEALGLLVFFVPVETQPAQPLEDGLHAGVGVALDIGVVEAQHHRAVVVAGVEPIEDKGARAAHVQKAGGRGRKANARSGAAGGAWIGHRDDYFPFTMLSQGSPAGCVQRLITAAAAAAGIRRLRVRRRIGHAAERARPSTARRPARRPESDCPKGTMFRSESQGEKPAFLQMNQKGMMTMARQIKMMSGRIAIMATTMC